MKENKKLYRSTTNRVIAGVCGGLGEYFDIDPTVVRIIFILITLADGFGIFLYFILALIIPAKNGEDWRGNAKDLAGRAQKISSDFQHSRHGKNFLGIFIVFIGLLVLVKNLIPTQLMWFNNGLIWPTIIIIIGLYLILKNKK